MNLVRTAMLRALMTALFMGVGYLIGGSGGMMIAFVIAAAMNLFSYWNADKMVLRMHHAVEVDERTAPEFYLPSVRPCPCRKCTSSTTRSPMLSPPGAIRRMRR